MFFLRRRTTEVPRRAERIMKRGKNTEKSHAIHKQMNNLREMEIRIRRGKNNRKHKNDLKSSSQLAEDAGRERPIPRDKQDHDGHHKNQNVAAENDNRQPPRDLLLERQNNKRR